MNTQAQQTPFVRLCFAAARVLVYRQVWNPGNAERQGYDYNAILLDAFDKIKGEKNSLLRDRFYEYGTQHILTRPELFREETVVAFIGLLSSEGLVGMREAYFQKFKHFYNNRERWNFCTPSMAHAFLEAWDKEAERNVRGYAGNQLKAHLKSIILIFNRAGALPQGAIFKLSQSKGPSGAG